MDSNTRRAARQEIRKGTVRPHYECTSQRKTIVEWKYEKHPLDLLANDCTRLTISRSTRGRHFRIRNCWYWVNPRIRAECAPMARSWGRCGIENRTVRNAEK